MKLSDVQNNILIRGITWYRIFNKIHKKGLWLAFVPAMIFIGIYLNLMRINQPGDKILLTAAVLYISELPMIIAITIKSARSTVVQMHVNFFEEMLLEFKLDETTFEYEFDKEANYFEFVMVDVACDLIMAKLL